VLAVCDPVAGILGINLQQYNNRIKLFGRELQKTWLGSLSFFVSCFIISLIALYFNLEQINLRIFTIAFTVAIVSTLAEMLSWKGSDNLFIPLSVLLVLVILL
jgi:dolichol kinase